MQARTAGENQGGSHARPRGLDSLGKRGGGHKTQDATLAVNTRGSHADAQRKACQVQARCIRLPEPAAIGGLGEGRGGSSGHAAQRCCREPTLT